MQHYAGAWSIAALSVVHMQAAALSALSWAPAPAVAGAVAAVSPEQLAVAALLEAVAAEVPSSASANLAC